MRLKLDVSTGGSIAEENSSTESQCILALDLNPVVSPGEDFMFQRTGPEIHGRVPDPVPVERLLVQR